MRKKLKTIVKQDFDMMAPYILRDQGGVPPLLFFHFKSIDEKVVEALNSTVQDDVLPVESGFFVPMSRESILQNREAFMDFMATIMAALKTVKITDELLYVVISVTGKAMKINNKTSEKESETDVFIVSGLDAKGETYTEAKELKMAVGTDNLVPQLVATSFLKEGVDNTANAFIGKNFFRAYETNLEKIPQDKENLGILEASREKYEGDAAAFTADLIDSAMHATVLLDSIKHTAQ